MCVYIILATIVVHVYKNSNTIHFSGIKRYLDKYIAIIINMVNHTRLIYLSNSFD